jgi:hypothetical protein
MIFEEKMFKDSNGIAGHPELDSVPSMTRENARTKEQ